MDTLTPGVYTTGDGSHSIISEQFKESYHSRHGALQESLHVFIESGLKPLLSLKKVRILEVGLGTGLNAWLSHLSCIGQDTHISYTGLEPFPIELELAKSLNYATIHQAEEHSNAFVTIHECEWNTLTSLSENFTFTKHKTTLQEHKTTENYDLCYFDAFAPNAHPELWTKEALESVYNLLDNNGIMVTYCAKGSVKRTLKEIGFEVKALPGPPGKREMTYAKKVE